MGRAETAVAPDRLLADGPTGSGRALRQAENEIRSLSAEILDRYEEATLVYRLCERLGSVLGEREIARTVLEELVAVLGAERGEIWLDAGEEVRLAAAVPAADAAASIAESPGGREVVEGGRPFLQEPAPGRESAVAVPLPGSEDRRLGALLLRGRHDGRPYRTGDVKLLLALASLTAAFVRNDRLATAAREAAARRREDEIARQIHRSLLPPSDPAWPGLDIAGACRAAERIGGDYYGYVPLPDGGLGIAVADVSGHGVGAALYMAAAKGALQAEARRATSPADLLRRTNHALAADFGHSDVFATAVFMRFHPGARMLDYSNGGHNPPLLFRRDGGVERLERGGAALGVLADLTYAEATLPFDEDDVLVLYTDGIVEARGQRRLFYGLERLIETSRAQLGRDAAAMRDAILADLDAHCGATPAQDDVTLVVVRGRPRGEAGGGAAA